MLMPDLDATCSLDLGCPHPSSAPSAMPTLIAPWFYANTSAAVKPALTGWSPAVARWTSCALKEAGQKILWAPDRHLGAYIQRETGADMVFWNGARIVHDEFKRSNWPS